MERAMKNLLFVALTVLSLSAGLVTARAANFHDGSTVEDTLSARILNVLPHGGRLAGGAVYSLHDAKNKSADSMNNSARPTVKAAGESVLAQDRPILAVAAPWRWYT
jgi:hypothetical protein